jgi:hypothetical protein
MAKPIDSSSKMGEALELCDHLSGREIARGFNLRDGEYREGGHGREY